MNRSYIAPYTLRAFTLIELLVVIAILGIIIALVVAGIDPVDKIRAANDAKVQSDIGAMGTAFEAYAALHQGTYASDIATLVTSGDLKTALTAPSGYTAYAGICTSACTTQAVYSNVRSKRYVTGTFTTSNTYWKWCSTNGKVGVITDTNAATTCP